VSTVFILGSSAFANDGNDLQRMRPSYHQIYDACASNPSGFKQNMYYNAYVQGMTTVVGAANFSTNSMSDLKYYNGLTAYVGKFLEGETTSLALSDCLAQDEHSAFIRNLLISEATGKFVGVAISAVEYRAFGAVSKKVGATLTFIPATLKRKILITTAVASSALGLKKIYKEYKEINEGKATPNDAPINAPNLSKDFKKKTQTTADANIEQLSELLKNPELSEGERAQLQTQLNNWNIIKSKLS
ncbi:MAG: hypothetical protein ACKOX6_06440, partial [Bdellovibrio sp.]